MPRALLAALLLGSATGQRTPAQRVYDELEAQVAFFPQITTSAEAAQVVAETLSHPYGLALLNGRVFARDHAGITRPYLRHLRLLLDAAASHRAANVVLAHDSVADGCITACVGCTPGSDERYLGIRALPSTRVTKAGGDACGVVVPEAGHAAGRERPAAVQRSTVPYGRRRAKAFWRGRLVEPGDDPALCVGNRARAEGLSLTLREPDLFDVKALSISPAWGRNGSCLPAAYEALRRTRSLRRVTEAKRQNHFARYNHYVRYKMLLHFPDRGASVDRASGPRIVSYCAGPTAPTRTATPARASRTGRRTSTSTSRRRRRRRGRSCGTRVSPRGSERGRRASPRTSRVPTASSASSRTRSAN